MRIVTDHDNDDSNGDCDDGDGKGENQQDSKHWMEILTSKIIWIFT